MRFFTMQWWCGEQPGDDDGGGKDDLFAKYLADLAANRERLPAERRPVLDALESVAVHDAKLRTLTFHAGEGTLHIALDAYWDGGQLALEYTGVRTLVSSADPNVGLGGPAGYGDVGYCEVDLSSDGAFIHRLLFSTGIEMEIVFTGGFVFRRSGTAEPGSGVAVGGEGT